MLRRHFFVPVAVSLAFVSSVPCQPTSVCLSYTPDGGNPPLGCPCEDTNGHPYPDGTTISLVHDNTPIGPDSSDAVVASWVFDANDAGMPAGYFICPMYLTLDSLQNPYYVRIITEGCCWHTIDFTFSPGNSDIGIIWADWICEDQLCWTQAPPSAPWNFSASDDSLCGHIIVSFADSNRLVDGYDIVRAADNAVMAVLSPADRQALVPVNSAQSQEYFVRAVLFGQTSAPSNTDLGSPFVVRFASDSTGDIRGTHLGGSQFTLNFYWPDPNQSDCSVMNTLILLSADRRVMILATDSSNAGSITAQLPDTSLSNCRVLLVASYLGGFPGFHTFDTTASVFQIGNSAAGTHGTPLPERTEIIAAYPNPFNPETRIRFTLATSEVVSLTIYNLAGQRVRTLVNGRYGAGEQSVMWDGRAEDGTPAGTGLYLCRMTTPHAVSTTRLLLLK